MGQALVIVESPAKAKTIGKYLGRGYSVKASIGHVKDLPKSKLGVDIEDNFKPSYKVISGKGKTLTELKKAAEKAEAIYLALDPDREGEAIAFHIAEELSKKRGKAATGTQGFDERIHRILFNEITKKAIQESITQPKPLDENLYQAQQARRILDRLVGYKISPLLWEKVRRGLSAGRVQSVTDSRGGIYTYSYDAAGNQQSLTYPNGAVTSYEYDKAHRVVKIRTERTVGEVIQEHDYQLSPTGIWQSVREWDGTVRSYFHDSLYRLIQERVTDGGGDLLYQNSFEYDPVGNRIRQERIETDQSVERIAYSYDSRDRLLSTWNWRFGEQT